jgi:hypothetical protein
MKQRVSNSRRIRFVILVAFALAGGLIIFHGGRSVGASALGPAPTFTNAPGEGNCTACHNSFAVNSGSGNVQLTGVPANYRLGQTATITVTVSMQDQVIYGFESTVLDGLGRNGGTLGLVTTDPMQTQLKDGIVGPNTRTYVEHTVDGVLPTQFGTKSWQFVWHAPTTPRGNITFYAAGNAANSDGGTNGDYIYTTSAPTHACLGLPDFDGDCKSDVSVFRSSNGGWYISRSSDNGFQGTAFGAAGDIISPGDFDGDGKSDIAVFRPSNGAWYALNSSNGAFTANIFGQSGDVPVVGDFDGDHKSDLAVFRPRTGIGTSFGLPTDSSYPRHLAPTVTSRYPEILTPTAKQTSRSFDLTAAAGTSSTAVTVNSKVFNLARTVIGRSKGIMTATARQMSRCGVRQTALGMRC